MRLVKPSQAQKLSGCEHKRNLDRSQNLIADRCGGSASQVDTGRCMAFLLPVELHRVNPSASTNRGVLYMAVFNSPTMVTTLPALCD